MTSGFFDQKRSDDRVANGRYQLDDPETGQRASWQRASNFGYPLSDHYGLTRWRHREILKGLAARPDLVRVLQAMHAAGEWDRGKLDEVLQTAQEVAGTTAEANEGTAIHDALRAADQGREYPEWAEPYVQSYRRELARHGLAVVLRERLVLNRALGVAGRIDAIYRTADGRFVVGDVKTTRHLELQEHEIAVQVGTYSGAEWIEGDDGQLRRLDAPIDRDEAIVVHVDREHATTAVYRLTLSLAQHGVNLAAQVRDWRTVKGLLLPYVRPAATIEPAVAPTLQAAEPAPIGAVQHVNTAGVAPEGEQQRHLTVVPGSRDAGTPAVRPAPSPNPGDEQEIAADHPGLTPMAVRSGDDRLTGAELAKMKKSEVQQYGRSRGFTDLAHNRPELIRLYGAAGLLTDEPGAAPPAEDPDDPRSDAFRAATMRAITEARTVGALGLLNSQIVGRHGDAAWTDEFTAAAGVRVEQLDAAGPAPGQAVLDVLRRVGACGSQQDLAALWSDVTIGGSVPDRWTAEIQEAANERLAAIRAALEPPAGNPFAGQ